MSNPETVIQNQIREAVSKFGICFRGNVGKVRMADGRIFDTGLPTGFSDLFGFRFVDGKMFFIEVKTATGAVRPAQKKFIKLMQSRGAIAGVARSVDDAIRLVNGGDHT